MFGKFFVTLIGQIAPMKSKTKGAQQPVPLKPMLGIALIWLFVLLTSNSVFLSWKNFKSEYLNIVLFWFLSIANLFFMLKTVASLLAVMSEKEADQQSVRAIRLLSWGSLKLIMLGIIVIALKLYSGSPFALASGFSTLFAVPVIGAFWWSHRFIRRREYEQ